MNPRPPDLRRFYRAVAGRAGHRCEFCGAPEAFFPNRFTLDHIVPRSAGEPTTLANLALCCFACQFQKLAFQAGVDPVTGTRSALFNPRQQRWGQHFRWSTDSLRIEGRTAAGRATVERLKLNHPRQVAARRRWKLHPELFP